MHTKHLTLAALATLLAACSGPGGSGSTTASIKAPGIAAPSLSMSDVSGKTYSMANGTLLFNSTQVVDTRCGATYTIASTSTSDGHLIIEADLDVASYNYPGNNDCMVATDRALYWTSYPCAAMHAQKPAIDGAYHIQYSIDEINGGLAITRSLTSRPWLMICGGVPANNVYSTDTANLAEENYF